MSIENPNWVSAFGLLVLDTTPVILRESGIESLIRISTGSYRAILKEKLTYNPPAGKIDGCARASMVDATLTARVQCIIYTPAAASPGDVQLLLYNAGGALMDGGTVFLTCNRFPTQD